MGKAAECCTRPCWRQLLLSRAGGVPAGGRRPQCGLQRLAPPVGQLSWASPPFSLCITYLCRAGHPLHRTSGAGSSAQSMGKGASCLHVAARVVPPMHATGVLSAQCERMPREGNGVAALPAVLLQLEGRSEMRRREDVLVARTWPRVAGGTVLYGARRLATGHSLPRTYYIAS